MTIQAFRILRQYASGGVGVASRSHISNAAEFLLMEIRKHSRKVQQQWC